MLVAVFIMIYSTTIKPFLIWRLFTISLHPDCIVRFKKRNSGTRKLADTLAGIHVPAPARPAGASFFTVRATIEHGQSFQPRALTIPPTRLYNT